MKLRDFTLGFLAAIAILLLAGATFAAIAPEGTDITVPLGKFALWWKIDNSDAVRIRDAVRYKEGNESITTTQGVEILHNYVRDECIRGYVLGQEANIRAEAARLQTVTMGVD